MDSQVIRLRWTSHQGTVLSVFDALLSSESLVDVTLACDGQYIRAHKVILSACSPYFQDLINIDPNKHPIFFLKDVKYTELKALIQYMYRGEVNIPQDDLPSLLAVAQALKIRGLADVETANNSIASDTIILPDLSNKSRVTKQPPAPAPPVVPVAPPSPVPAPTSAASSFNMGAPRNFPEHSFTQNSVPPSPIGVPIAATGPPTPKKPRTETRSSTQAAAAAAAALQKQSQMIDPLLDVQSAPIKSQLTDPLQAASTSSTSSHYDSPGYSGHSRDRDYGQSGMVEDTEPFEIGVDVMKLEATGPIDIELEEEENSMSQSSFSEPWQMGDGDGDNSQMPDDDGEMPGGSGNNDGGAEGGEVYVVPIVKNKRFYCTTPNCGRSYTQRNAAVRHIQYECNKEGRYQCGYCDYRSHWPICINRHLRIHHAGVSDY